ncbi:hypothetical protein, partial [Ruegeria sp. Ofav3-42]|uniref:hypothetical protein n=1 Tax=Ruegeria sp. Ofav3-42 TaxID=2917759 RepID=UPI001EF6C618
ACFLFLDHLDDLFVGESRLHLSVLKLGGLYTKLEEIQGLRSPAGCSRWRCAVVLRRSIHSIAPPFRKPMNTQAFCPKL